jgi:hypothetical protein
MSLDTTVESSPVGTFSKSSAQAAATTAALTLLPAFVLAAIVAVWTSSSVDSDISLWQTLATFLAGGCAIDLAEASGVGESFVIQFTGLTLPVYAAAGAVAWWRFRSFLRRDEDHNLFIQQLLAVPVIASCGIVLITLYASSQPVSAEEFGFSVNIVRAVAIHVFIVVAAWLLAAARNTSYSPAFAFLASVVTTLRAALPAIFAAATSFVILITAVAWFFIVLFSFTDASQVDFSNLGGISEGLNGALLMLLALPHLAFGALAVGTFGGASVELISNSPDLQSFLSVADVESVTFTPFSEAQFLIAVPVALLALFVSGFLVKRAGWSPRNSRHTVGYLGLWSAIALVGVVATSAGVTADLTSEWLTGGEPLSATVLFMPGTYLAALTIPVAAYGMWWAAEFFDRQISTARPAASPASQQ